MKASSGQGSITIENGTITIKAPLNPPTFQVPTDGVTVSIQRGALGSKVTFLSPHGQFTATMVSKADVEKILGELPESQAPIQPPIIVPQQPTQPTTETKVKTYKNAKDYQRDVKSMQRQGWMVQNTVDHHRDRSMAYKMFVPFGAFSGGTGQIVVTYQREKK